MNLDELLNESQKAAVEYNEGASVIVAGAGSGKTRVLTYKIAYLLEQGMMAYNILALTFTNKAAREMKERIMKVVGPSASRGLWMGTFHTRTLPASLPFLFCGGYALHIKREECRVYALHINADAPFFAQRSCATNKKRRQSEDCRLVNSLGLEPRTPTLKVLCSTC